MVRPLMEFSHLFEARISFSGRRFISCWWVGSPGARCPNGYSLGKIGSQFIAQEIYSERLVAISVRSRRFSEPIGFFQDAPNEEDHD